MLHSIEPFVSARQDNDDMEQQQKEKGNPGMDSSGEGSRPPSLPDQIGLDLWLDGCSIIFSGWLHLNAGLIQSCRDDSLSILLFSRYTLDQQYEDTNP